jgi:hypothetical protein
MVATWQNEPNAPKEECADLGNHFQREGANMTKAVLGIIGGSGICDLPGLKCAKQSPWANINYRANIDVRRDRAASPYLRGWMKNLH